MTLLIAFVLGIGLCAMLPELPSPWTLCGLWLLARLSAVCAATGWRRQTLVLLSALLLGLAWADWRAQWRLADSLPEAWEQVPVRFVAVVRGLPSVQDYGTRLTLEVERTLTPGLRLPKRIIVTVYARKGETQQSWPAGSRWKMGARLRRPHAPANRYGFDAEQWLWSEGVLATGSASGQALPLGKSHAPLAQIDRWREQAVARIETVLGDTPEAGLVAGLTVGAQSRIGRQEWRWLADTGLTHLVSISGLHISMVAGVFAALARLWQRRWPSRRLPPRMVVAMVSLAAASFYAAMAGLSVPTQRTLGMLAVMLLMYAWRRHWSGFHLWWMALAAVLAADPFAVLTPGLWLSFGLVAALIASGMARRGRLPWWRSAFAGQWAATLCGVLPLIWWFGRYPLITPLANLWAIPLVSFALTPLCLLAVVLPWDGLMHAAGWLAGMFYHWTARFAEGPMLSLPAPPWQLAALAFVGSLLLIAPRGMPVRLLGAGMFMPMLLYAPERPPHGAFRATVLDVGQGLSVLVQTGRHTLLFDTGIGDAGLWVLPQLRGLGAERLDMLVLSHHDNDHDGAAQSLVAESPPVRILAGQRASLEDYGLQGEDCRQGMSWVWDGVRFDVLSPPDGLGSAEDNDHSCVLRVAGLRHALLLTGDAPSSVEQRLATRYGDALRSTVLVAGHHGSRTSTSGLWLDTVKPELAVISAGYRNRYRHPHPTVMARLADRGITVLRTDQDGMLEMEVGAQVWFDCHRSRNRRYWRPQGECGA